MENQGLKMEYDFGDQNVILQVFYKEFCKHFKNDHLVDPSKAMPLSRDLISWYEGLTRAATDEEITQVVH